MYSVRGKDGEQNGTICSGTYLGRETGIFLDPGSQSWQMVLLPSKYLTHLIRANRSPNTVGRRAKSIRFYLEYLNETELELSQVAEQEFQEQYEHYVGFLHWLKLEII